MGSDNLACYFDSMGIGIVWIPCGCHRGITIKLLSKFLNHYASVICYSCRLLSLGLFLLMFASFYSILFWHKTSIIEHVHSLIMRHRTMSEQNLWFTLVKVKDQMIKLIYNHNFEQVKEVCKSSSISPNTTVLLNTIKLTKEVPHYLKTLWESKKPLDTK
jgi:hypothetical protein